MLKRYNEGTASEEEIEFVTHYYQQLEKKPANEGHITDQELNHMADESYQRIWDNIELQQQKPSKRFLIYKRCAAAAAILLLLGTGLFLLINKPVATQQLAKVKAQKTIDILPGIDQAVLILADGSKIVLDQQNQERVVHQTGLSISKTKDGILVYTAIGQVPKDKSIGFNTIQTAKGNQYQLILPDGSKVWLNASSSLKFPEIFNGTTRNVELKGEGYFEIAKDKAHPFIVKTIAGDSEQEIEVLGTHFNVNSYLDDEQIKTTLLEGSVRVKGNNISKVLVPGQQAQLDSKRLKVVSTDVDDETAWKNGLFRFNNMELKNILYQLERWYDIKVDYSSVPTKRYNGMIPRKVKLSEVLNMLSLTGNVDFRIEENKQLKVHLK